MGVELAAPRVSEAALQANFTNEIASGGTVRFLKNVMGLWLVQECRRAWERAGQDPRLRRADAAGGRGAGVRGIVEPDHAASSLRAGDAGRPGRLLPSQRAAGPGWRRADGAPVPWRAWPCVTAAVLEKLEELTGRVLR